MAFDEKRYVEEYLKKRDVKRGLPDDLVERYAITLPASDAEIAAQVRAVRSCWNGFKPGARGADIVKLCRSADEALRAQHGDDLLCRDWWTKYADGKRSAAEATVTKLAERLKSAYGQLGVVTATTIEALAATSGLSPQQATDAARKASLTVVPPTPLPSVPGPIAGRFTTLQVDLQACGARTIPELLHPGSGEFRIRDGYECLADRQNRLDVAAVSVQMEAAQKTGAGTSNDARRAALQSIRSAAEKRVDLTQLAFAHLVDLAAALLPQGLETAWDGLAEVGLARPEAAVIVVLLADQSTTAGAAGVAKVEQLLAEGRLAEARQAAQSMPDGSKERSAAIKRVDTERTRLDDLLTQVRQAVADGDETRAASLVREAELISGDDAEEALAAVPLTPPAGLRLVSDGDSVKLFWQPSAGHGDDTTYIVIRSDTRPPSTPADGTELGRESGTTFVDPHSLVARTVYYSVFAAARGRPSSRAAGATITVLPPVANLAADVGPSEVTVHWSTHPACHETEASRTEPGNAPTKLTVSNNSCYLGGLVEGQSLHFEITAVYRGVDGSVLRSSVAQINATPRSEASPIGKLRARPIDVAGEVRLRISWTPVDGSEVRILRSASPVPWTTGTWITADDMGRFGAEVTGRHVTGRSEVAIEAEIPPGVHHLVPVSIGGTGMVVGASTTVGVTDPVTNLVATPFATYATLSWQWPTSSQLAEVTWEVDGEVDVYTIGKSEYQTQGGARVPLGREPSTVEVRAMIRAQAASFTSPPVTLRIDAVNNVEIGYVVSDSPLARRNKKVTFTSAEGCRGVHVRMVASPGPVMPTSPDDKFILLDAALDLPPGEPVVHSVTVPRAVSRPYWVRCFIVGGRGRMVDPPITDLKE